MKLNFNEEPLVTRTFTSSFEFPPKPPRPMKSRKWLRRRNKKWFRQQNFLDILSNSFADRIALDWEDHGVLEITNELEEEDIKKLREAWNMMHIGPEL